MTASPAHGTPFPFEAVTVPAAESHIVLVRVRGELDMDAAEQAVAYLASVTRSGPRHLVVDVSDVHFLSSRGLGALVEANLGRRGVQGRLHLTGVRGNRPVERVISMAGLSDSFAVHDDLDALLDELGARRR